MGLNIIFTIQSCFKKIFLLISVFLKLSLMVLAVDKSALGKQFDFCKVPTKYFVVGCSCSNFLCH